MLNKKSSNWLNELKNFSNGREKKKTINPSKNLYATYKREIIETIMILVIEK